MFSESLIYSMVLIISGWFSRQFNKSRLLGFFLNNRAEAKSSESSIFFKIYNTVLGFLRKGFHVLKLDRLFYGSIFKETFIWCLFAVFAAPILPTMAVLILALAAFLSLMLRLLCDKGEKLKYYAINKYIYIYAGIYLFATFTSVDRNGSLLGGILAICFMLFFVVVVNSIKTKKQLNILLFLFVCAGILVALYGFYQYMLPSKFSGLWHDTEYFESITFRVYSTLDNPNVLGEYFLLAIPIAFALFLNSDNIIIRLFYMGATGLMLLVLILTYSRGCYVGILVAMGMFLVLVDRRFIILGVLGIIALAFLLPENIINRFLSIGDMTDTSTSYRFYIYMGTIGMLKQYWLCGIGPGTGAFNIVYPSYAYNGISAPHAHNLFLQVMCDCGIAGILVFIAIIYQFYKAAFSSLTRTKDIKSRILIIAGISSVSGFMVQSMFDYTFYNYRVMLLFWVVLALGILFTDIPSLREEGVY